VDPEVAWERRDRLLTLQAEISAERNAEFVGRKLDVLVEGIDEEGEVVGRIYAQAPEVDGLTRLPDYPDEVVEVGRFVKARIVEAQPYDLVAREVEV
jgi:ribosomal protein S12 methylthiotransferase